MRYIFVLIFTFLLNCAYPQQNEIKLSPAQIEYIFINNNIELMAEKLNISIADANIVQAKLWDNPQISIGGMNLWSTKSQREEMTFPGSFAKHTQFTAELSQIISVSGRRAKLANMERVSKEIEIQRFEAILKGVKLELRTLISEIYYQEQLLEVLTRQKDALSQLNISSEKQYESKNLSKREFLRIQAALLEAENEIYNLRKELNNNQKTLKNLLSTTEYVYLKIEMDSLLFPSPENINIMLLTEKAFEENPEINIMKLQTQYYDKSIKYEKSLRIPDLNFNVSYDRGGDIWRDFVGFGVGIDIPVFNRNQGAIKAAQISAEQSRYQYKQEENILKNNITESFLNYSESYNIYEKVRKNDLTENLDEMLDLFTKNILNKNISMIEYMDFMDSFKQTKDIILSSIKDTIQQLEELKYYTSTEILD